MVVGVADGGDVLVGNALGVGEAPGGGGAGAGEGAGASGSPLSLGVPPSGSVVAIASGMGVGGSVGASVLVSSGVGGDKNGIRKGGRSLIIGNRKPSGVAVGLMPVEASANDWASSNGTVAVNGEVGADDGNADAAEPICPTSSSEPESGEMTRERSAHPKSTACGVKDATIAPAIRMVVMQTAMVMLSR